MIYMYVYFALIATIALYVMTLLILLTNNKDEYTPALDSTFCPS